MYTQADLGGQFGSRQMHKMNDKLTKYKTFPFSNSTPGVSPSIGSFRSCFDLWTNVWFDTILCDVISALTTVLLRHKVIFALRNNRVGINTPVVKMDPVPG